MEQFVISTDKQPTAQSQEQIDKVLEIGTEAVAKGNSKFDENGNLVGKPTSSAQPTEQQAANNNQESTNNDDGIPDKFKDKDGKVNVEALLKSYKELEKSKGTNQEQATQNTNQEQKDKPNQELKINTVEDAINVATEKGVDYNKLSEEYAKTGGLSEDTYSMLNTKGIPKEVVQQFLAGQQAQANAIRSEILSSVGGEEKYIEMTKWAKTNLSESELASYNKAMNTNDRGIIDFAVNGLKAKYTNANGIPPKLVTGNTPSGGNTSNLQPFKSQSEMIEAMKDPRYNKIDPTYRNEVAKRIAASKF